MDEVSTLASEKKMPLFRSDDTEAFSYSEVLRSKNYLDDKACKISEPA